MGFWFNSVMPEFCPLAMAFSGLPILYAEIGTWKGNSAEWVCKHVLTHPESRGVGIDSYPADFKRTQQFVDENVKAHAVARMKRFSDAGKWSWIFEKSQDALRTWERGVIDVLYIDGSHLAHDVMMDFCFAWPHLRDGSLVIFDDFQIGQRRERKGLRHVPTACAAIARCFEGMIDVVNPGGRQYAVRVKNKLPLGVQPDQAR